MKIIEREPSSWQELQDVVGRLFSDVGYHVEISKRVDLVRGSKEIDVYVEDLNSDFKSTFLIECKFWNKPVNQEVVHAFHTVVNGYGANHGFIVSKRGFQSGSHEASKNTNIELLTLDDLERRYYRKWQTGMVNKFMPFADELFPYWDFPGSKRLKDNGPPLDWTVRQLLLEAYGPVTSLGPQDVLFGFERKFPQKIPILNDDFSINGFILLNNDREYFQYVDSVKEKALWHFKQFWRELD